MADASFGSKLRQMRLDLMSVVDRMNRDRSVESAMAAQAALVAIAALEHQLDQEWGDLDDLSWEWQPEAEAR